MNRHVVIGAGYGDEAKGVFTDYFSHEMGDVEKYVVRFNGGAQAGHTVTLPDGRRHVFHHFGSGTFNGSKTHLSNFFVVNPIMFHPEFDVLSSMNAVLNVSVDPRAIVTTPYDMMMNQVIEMVRSNGRHGSCGMGFGESIERSLRDEFSFTMNDVFSDFSRIEKILSFIRREWVPMRLSLLGVDSVPDEYVALLDNDAISDAYLRDIFFLRENVSLKDDSIVVSSDNVVLEGAQGLMLDQDYGSFPHVTRSNTGLKNVVSLFDESGVRDFSVSFLHRAYTTRHGAGPLKGEIRHLNSFDVVDETNVQNPWQGTLRFAPFDVDEFVEAVEHDLVHADGFDVDVAIGISCLDQSSGFVDFVDSDVQSSVPVGDFTMYLMNRMSVDHVHESWGPTRNTIKTNSIIRS